MTYTTDKPETIGCDELVRMLLGAVAQVKTNKALLSKLDSRGGDGDHGTTMVRAMNVVESTAHAPGTRDIKTLLYEVGWAILGVDGGATGPLFGTFFLGMSEAAAGTEALDATGLASLFEAGLASVRKQTKAQVGDKTIMDALVPAVAALRQAADSGASVSEALRQAAEAAEQGALSTKDLRARFGRAKNIGEKSVGAQNPGATSVSLMVRGFFEGVNSHA